MTDIYILQNFSPGKQLGTIFAITYMSVKSMSIKNNSVFSPVALFPGPAAVFSEAKTEIIRKSIHFLIALCPVMAAVSQSMTMLVLLTGIICYTAMEMLRLSGVKVPLVSAITGMASRPRDMGRFVFGPVTLGTGALFTLLLFPTPVASIAIFALAFGDGFASLIGKFFGTYRPAVLFGKSVEGSLACFTATYFCAYLVSGNFIVALIAAVTATAVEALPLEDYDNIALPLAVGVAVQIAMM